MIATKFPFGAICESDIESILFHPVYNKFYLKDKYGSTIEIEESVFNSLKQRGYRECTLN